MSSLFRRRISNPPERLADSPPPPSRKHNISPKIYAIFLENYTIDF
nr:MAG TPA: hypothetical protein [Caudoviricetes sp.]